MVAMVMSRPALGVLGDDAAEIHAVKLVAAENEQKIKIVIEKMQQGFSAPRPPSPDTTNCPKTSARPQEFHEPAREMVKLVGLRNMAWSEAELNCVNK